MGFYILMEGWTWKCNNHKKRLWSLKGVVKAEAGVGTKKWEGINKGVYVIET